MKAIQLLVNSQLPVDLRDYNRELDSKSIGSLMAEVARKYPDQYERISKSISDIGRKASYFQGETLTLNDNRPVIDRDKIYAEMDIDIDAASKEHSNKDDFENARLTIWEKYNNRIQSETAREALALKNNLAYSVVSGARGKIPQLKMMISTPGLYTDSQDKIIPLFVRTSFGEGLRPAEYLASTYGARKAVLATKRATAKGGDLAKQMVQSAARLVITENDCGASNGIDLSSDDSSLKGRVLARGVNGVPAGTLLDKNSLANIRKQGINTLIVRSPMTCQSKEGICAKCLGVNAEGKFPAKGESVGITAAQAISEPITQGALNCLAQNTVVLMADYSEKYIQDIKPGELVMGADVRGNIFPTKVTHAWDQGLQPVQRRFYKMGQTKRRVFLESTEAHPVLSNRKTYGITYGKNNYVPEKLIAGYKHKNLAAVLPVNNNSHGVAEPWAVFLGAYLGDGIRWDSDPGKSNSITFSCADKTEAEDINQILKPLNVQLVKCSRSYDWRVSMLEDNINNFTDVITGQVLKGYRNPCKLKLIEYGLNDKYAHEKTIHPSIWNWSNQAVADLVAGFIATDGSVYKNSAGHIGIAFTSTSENLLLELQKLLQYKLCVYSSSLTCTAKVGTGSRKHAQWQFTITRFDQIKRLFSFIESKIPGVKNQRIKDYISNAKYDLRNTDVFYRALRADSAEEDLGLIQCYDITVEHEDSLFVLANSLIVSNTKHQGGAAGTRNSFSGFAAINQFVQTPDTFPDKAILSKKDGQVNSIIDAPQGGYYVSVDNEPHYVAPGYPVTVRVGERVEAGSYLSEGLADPGEIVELKGLGAGRKYYSDRLKQLLDDSGMETDRRNTEIMSRAALDHLQISDVKEGDDYLPDDVVSYTSFANTYTPPTDSSKTNSLKSIGTYLQSPALHYTIGTRITPSIAKHLDDVGFKDVFTSKDAPTFKPHMVRLRAATHYGTDWLASMHTSYIKKQLNESAIRGEESDIENNIHFAPRLAIGQGFGENIERTGKF
jgi:hypothetical protein